jgi:DNA-binding NtrC family response regulator
LVERAFILEKGSELQSSSFPPGIFNQAGAIPALQGDRLPTLGAYRGRAVELAERQYLTQLLSEHKGRIAPSAATAGVSTRQLHKLMTKYGLRKEDFKEPRK